MEKTVRRSFIGTWSGKNTELGMLVCAKKRVFLSVCVDDIKLAGEETAH